MKNVGGPSTPLEVALDGVQEVKDSGSLMFIADTETTTKIKEILTSIDTPTQARSTGQAQPKSSFLIYNPQYLPGDELQLAVKETADNLQQSGLADPSFMQAIASVRWVPTTNSLIFTGDPQSLERIQGMLKNIDTAQHATGALSQGFFLYKLQYAACDKVVEELKNVVSNFSGSTIQNQNLLAVIDKIQCIKSNNSLLILGSSDAVEQVKSLIAEFDVPTGTAVPTGTFLIYKAKYLPADEIQLAMKSLALTCKRQD